MKQTKRLKTREQVRAEFTRTGQSVAAWARTHKLNLSLVYEVLNNPERRCLRGQSHRVAVLLGIKDGLISDSGAAGKAATRKAA